MRPPGAQSGGRNCSRDPQRDNTCSPSSPPRWAVPYIGPRRSGSGTRVKISTQHRLDGSPRMFGEFVAHSSRLRFGRLQPANPATGISKITPQTGHDAGSPIRSVWCGGFAASLTNEPHREKHRGEKETNENDNHADSRPANTWTDCSFYPKS